MLEHIAIRDLAIVEELEVDLDPGMTVLTGETGAGKSILIGALNLALGERGSAELVRPGRERAEVGATFDLSDIPSARGWLAQHDLTESDGECILRRTIARDGRSRGYINGRAVPASHLREFGSHLVDIHGQHAHQSLLRRDAQRRILDEYAELGDELEELEAVYRRWAGLQRELETEDSSELDHEARLELLQYQRSELDALALEENEIERLEAEHRRLGNANEIITACEAVSAQISGDADPSTFVELEKSLATLASLGDVDRRLDQIYAELDAARIQMKEAAADLRHFSDGLEVDPERYDFVEQRLNAAYELARKHRVKPDRLVELRVEISAGIDRLEGVGGVRARIQREAKQVEKDYHARAETLSTRRRSAAGELADEVMSNMHQLGMPGGRVSVQVTRATATRPSAHGLDQVELTVSTNPGQPLQPLARVASGGELSRISLALQVVTVRGTGVPTLVFDEVDVGVGGKVADIVGQQLRRLSLNRQVLCITHLPQVASQAESHLRVLKRSTNNDTWAILERVRGERRVDEIARMLGGADITAQTLAHAEEMLQSRQGELADAAPGG